MSEIAPLAAALVAWFEREGKSYPWRDTCDPWFILVSEVMLQQTTISTVIARYMPWMEQFPTPRHLAEASEEQALRSWEGLGYYRRVRNLQAAAKAIVECHAGQFPRAEADIKALPGIGDYTLGAVLSFAYNQAAPLVDANVSRVLARVFNDPTPIDSTAGKKRQWQQARELLHSTNARAYNSALMELGQRICSIAQPQCLICPIREYCRATEPEKLPVKQAKTSITEVEHWDIFYLDPIKGLLMEQQADSKRHAGMYRFPSRPQAQAEQYPLLAKQKYSVTRYKVTRYLHQAPSRINARKGEVFIKLSELASTPMASPDRKLVNKLIKASI
ncbi:MAG: A/G-specific adenine glycosylase [Akkermansia sp.]